MQPIRLVIADDHHVFVDGLKALLETEKTLQVVGQVYNGKQLIDKVAELGDVDVVISDISMPVMNGNLTISFHTNIEQLHLPQWLELSIYRIAHQLIKNITLHAQASKSSVQLIARDNLLILKVEDNGRGFDVKEEMQNEKNRGLRNTQIRVKILNGKINIDSTPGQGTCITIEIPYFPRTARTQII